MAYQSKFRHIPVEDIRAASISYEQLIMRGFDRLGLVINECMKQESYAPVNGAIRFLDSLLQPYHDEEYTKTRDGIKGQLEDIENWKFNHFLILMEWVALMTTKFSEMDILPEQNVSYIMGVGEAKDHLELLK